MPAPDPVPIRVTLLAPLDLQAFGARIERPVTRAIASRWRPAWVEDGVWVVDLDPPAPPELPGGAPAPPGATGYQIAWLTQDAATSYEVIVPLEVS